MTEVSKTECAICFEMIRYGARVESTDVWDSSNGEWIYATVHAGCANTYDPPEDAYDDVDPYESTHDCGCCYCCGCSCDDDEIYGDNDWEDE